MKKNNVIKIVVVFAVSLLFLVCLTAHLVSKSGKHIPPVSGNATTNKFTIQKNVIMKKACKFTHLSFIKGDNSEIIIRALITEKGFVAIPLDYFYDLQEIVWKEDSKEIVIDSGIYWQLDMPFLLLKVPYENQENTSKITMWDFTKSLLWESNDFKIQQVIDTQMIGATRTKSCCIEIKVPKNSGDGLLMQGQNIVGWTFSTIKNRAYLWTGMREEELIPNLELSTLAVLLNTNLQEKIKKSLVVDGNVITTMKNLSHFFIKNTPNKNWNHVIIPLLNSVCISCVAKEKYREVLSIINHDLLSKSQDLVLLECYARANLAIYGYDLTISLLNRLIKDKNTTPDFYNNLVSLIVNTYIQKIKELLYYKRYDDVINTYHSAISQYPKQQDLEIAGIEIYIELNAWQKAEEILYHTIFDTKYIQRLQELKILIEKIKVSENKIVIKFTPNEQRNIFVDGTINEEINQKFILDTGASIVSIPLSTASTLGIDVVNGNYTPRMIATASGIFATKEVILQTISIGGKKIYNIPAVVIDLPQDKNLGLLGMNFLSRFQVELNNEKGEIILTPKE